MPRVNHKRVKELLKETRSKITDRQFFSSRILAGYFEDIATAQTKRYRYNRRVRVNLFWKPKVNDLAFTDNITITINSGHSLVTNIRGRLERFYMVFGLFVHELGHVLYTDFLMKQTYLNSLGLFRWYPDAPPMKCVSDITNEKALWDYAKADPRNIKLLQRVASEIANILEDAFVENCIFNQFPGTLSHNLEYMRQKLFEAAPTVSEMEEQETDGDRHIFNTILQILLSYSSYGEIKYGDTPLSDERIQTIFKMIPEIDLAVTTSYAKERWKIVSFIMVRCWKYLEDYLELCKKKYDEATASGGTLTDDDILTGMLGGLVGTTAAGTGSGTPVPGTTRIKNTGSHASVRANTKAMAAAGGTDENESEESGENASESGDPGDVENQSGETGSDVSNPVTSAENESGTPDAASAKSQKQKTQSEEGDRIPFHHTDSVSDPVGGETEFDDDYQREAYDDAASDIERLLEEMATKAAQKQAEGERLQELNEAAQNISYGNIHTGVPITVHRIKEVDEDLIQQYHTISGPLLTISQQLQRSLKQKLQDQQRGGKQTGLVMGRRLDAHALCRNDGKVFYKNNLPNEIPRISVGLLLDESGSMRCGNRSTYARSSAIIIHDFCQSLNIPIMIYGHSTGWGNDVDLYSYAEFDSIDNMDMYRLMDISARGCNRDGAALRYVAEQLVKRPEEIRLLMLLSDGQPSADGYDGTAAEEDLRGIKQEYRRKGILFVAAAIGDDKQNIERIYGDSFLDITDLNQLPVKLTAVIKRFMR